MSNKIVSGNEITKELGQIQGSGFQLEDISANVVARKQVKPQLLTALLGPTATTDFLRTDTFRYDATEATSQLPSGKAYNKKGKDLQKDKDETFRWGVPSFGIRSNVAPQDYIGRRVAGTNELKTEAHVVSEMNTKAMEAFSLMDEVGIAQLITTDTNYVGGGPFQSFNFYTAITGGPRAAAKTDMDLGTGSTDHVQLFRKQRRLLSQELERSMDSASMFVCFCGDTFFDKRYNIEQNTGLARPIKFGLDLASQPINEDSFGAGTYNYAYFDSMDGIRYINYGSTIIDGSKLIGDDDAYLVPVGAKNMLKFAYAPSNTRTYANTEAQSLYAWTMTDEFNGVTTFYESNKLFSSVNPRLVATLTSST